MDKAILIAFALILLSCAAMAGLRRVERFEINDYYSKYLNDLAAPTAFYGQMKTPVNFKLAEMNDKYFKYALDAAVEPRAIGESRPARRAPENLLELSADRVAAALNAKLPSGESQVFAVAFSAIDAARELDGGAYVVDARHVVHRDSRAYGAAIRAKTLHDPRGSTALLSYELIGFVFEDRMPAAAPANLFERDANPEYSRDAKLTRDAKYELEYACKYLTDLERYRGMTVDKPAACDSLDQSYPS